MDTASLPEIWKRLSAELGDRCPALITLKRWSAQGRIGAGGETTRGRKRYSYAEVREAALKEYSKQMRVTPGGRLAITANGSRARRGAEAGLAEIERKVQAAVDAGVAGLATKIERVLRNDVLADAVARGVAQITAEVTEGLKGMEVSRKAMMLKYDGVDSLLRAKIAALEEENGRLKAQGMNIDLQRLNATLRQLLDKLAGL